MRPIWPNSLLPVGSGSAAGKTQSTGRSSAIFIAVNVLAIAQTWTISTGCARFLLPAMGIRTGGPEIAHAIGLAIPAFTSYIGHKFWSFR